MSSISGFLSYKPMYGENNISFYINRLFNTYTRKRFEHKKKPFFETGEKMSLKNVVQCLEMDLVDNLTNIDADGNYTFLHQKSLQHSKHSHNLLGTKTWCKALIYRYADTGQKVYLDYLTEGAKYLLSKQTKCGLYRYEQPLGLSQDEGPVTAGTIQVLCDLYKLSKDDSFKNAAINAANAAKEYLFDDSFGYLHTRGRKLCTTNINSSFAHSFALLFQVTQDEEWYCESKKCISLTARMMNEEGMFKYSNENENIFVSLYHFMIIIALQQINAIFPVDNYESIVNRASIYGKKLLLENGLIIEPDSTQVLSLFRTCTRAALMYELIGESDIADRIINQFGLFIHDSKAYASMTFDNRITDGPFWYRRERHLADAYADLAFLSLIKHD